MSEIEIKFYKVRCGDCIYIRYCSEKEVINIFIDAGYVDTYKSTLKPEIKRILENGEQIHLFVITHIDQDHISGMTPFLKVHDISLIQDLWFNHADKFKVPDTSIEKEISIKQGINLRDHCFKKGYAITKIIADEEKRISNISFKILSPTTQKLEELIDDWEKKEFEFDVSPKANDHNKPLDELYLNPFEEDTEPPNGSSIAFLLEVDDFSAIFSADAHPTTLYQSLLKLGFSKDNPLKLNLFKVPHHGSKKNLSTELIEIIDCDNYVFSANGINRDNLPNKETIARIARYSPAKGARNLFFNHDNETLRNITTFEEKKEHNLVCYYAKSTLNCLKFNFKNGILNFE